jgi:hypothetical protein
VGVERTIPITASGLLVDLSNLFLENHILLFAGRGSRLTPAVVATAADLEWVVSDNLCVGRICIWLLI